MMIKLTLQQAGDPTGTEIEFHPTPEAARNALLYRFGDHVYSPDQGQLSGTIGPRIGSMVQTTWTWTLVEVSDREAALETLRQAVADWEKVNAELIHPDTCADGADLFVAASLVLAVLDQEKEPTLITGEQAAEWAGRSLSVDELDRLSDCIPFSSIPDAIGTVVDSWANDR